MAPLRREDSAEVGESFARLLMAIDELDWEGVRSLLCARVTTDYTSLFGGAPVEQTAEELVAVWERLLPGFDSTQHLLGPVATTASEHGVRARCAVTATHALGSARWVVGGHYDSTWVPCPDGWRLAALRLRTSFVDGDRDLPKRAAGRTTERRG